MKLACFLGCLLVIAPLGLAAQRGGASFGIAGTEPMGQNAAQRPTSSPHCANRAPGQNSSCIFTYVGSDGQVTTYIVTPPSPAASCPVGMKADHLSDGSMIKTGSTHPKDAHPKGIGQRLHLTLTSPDQRTIASATLKLLGWNATGRMERAALHNEDQSARTVTASFTAGPADTASADVWASGLTAVTSVELLSVRYSDGSTWTSTQGKTCSVSPDPMMLIANQ